MSLYAHFFVKGIPAPQGSKRHVGNGVLIESSKKLDTWRDTIATIARIHCVTPCVTPCDVPVSVVLSFVLPRPKNWGKSRNDPMTQRPDIDKLSRAVLDALSGIVYRDDSQVIDLWATKRRARHGESSGVNITVFDPPEGH